MPEFKGPLHPDVRGSPEAWERNTRRAAALLPYCPPGAIPAWPDAAIGNAAATTGMPTVPKPGAIAGGGRSGKWTSPASTALRDMTGRARWKNVLRPMTGTSSIGGSIDKILPGWGAVLAFDEFRRNMDDAMSDRSLPPGCIPGA
jgi:hypothetical protein